MNPLIDILTRNQGQILTPELIVGILHGFDAALPEHLCSVVPTRIFPELVHDDPRLVCNNRERVGTWVAQRVGMRGQWSAFGAIGLLDEDKKDLVAGVVLEGMTATNAFIHVAFEGKYALKRVLLRAVFDYAFNQLDLSRLTAYVDADNEASLRFVTHIGFELEHVIKNGNAGDVMMLALWREQCRWLPPRQSA